MKIYFGSNASDAYPTPVIFDSFKNFCDTALSVCNEGPKDGPYFACIKTFKDGTNRNTNNVLESQMVCLDADKTISDKESCVPMEIIHQILKKNDINHFIYSSHSHIPEERNRYRVVFEVYSKDHDQLKANVSYIYSLLTHTGMNVESTSSDQARLWYLPRSPKPDEYFQCLSYTSGNNLSPQEYTTPQKISVGGQTTETLGLPISEMLSIISNGVSDTGLHDCTRNFAYQLVKDGVQPGTVEQIIQHIMKDYDLSDARQKENWEKVPALVASASKKRPTLSDVPRPLPQIDDFINEVKFPTEILPEVLLNAAKEISEFNMNSIHDVIPGILSTCAASIGRKAKVQESGAYVEKYIQMSVVNIAGTGQRKTTAFSLQTKGLIDGIADKISRYKQKINDSKSEIKILKNTIAKRENDAVKNEDNKDDLAMILKEASKIGKLHAELEVLENPRQPYVVCDDTTPERSLEKCFLAGGECLFFADEGQGYLKAMSDSYNKGSFGNTDFVVRSSSGSLVSNDRKSSKEEMTFNAVSSTNIFVQPDIFKSQFLMVTSLNSSGLSSRQLYHYWGNEDYENLKDKDRTEINLEKLEPYWQATKDFYCVDDRDYPECYSTEDDFNHQVIKPITKVIAPVELKGAVVGLYNSIRTRFAKGNNLEGEEESVNKCLSFGYIGATVLYAYRNPLTFFKKREHIITTEFLEEVDTLSEYFIQKKLVENKIHMKKEAIRGAAQILHLITSKNAISNALSGMTESGFKRILNYNRSLKQEMLDAGEVMLREHGFLIMEKNKLVLNPGWEKSWDGAER